MKAFPLRLGQGKDVPSLMLEVLASAMKNEKELKAIGKEKIKLSSLTDNMIVYIENSKESIKKKTIGLVSEFSKVEINRLILKFMCKCRRPRVARQF